VSGQPATRRVDTFNFYFFSTVSLSHGHRLTPHFTDSEFQVGDDVDAYYNEGWWEGVVTEELAGGRLGVFFNALRELIGFEKEDLRLHRDWVHGKWVPPFEQDEVGI
jgi:hypothetical protein